MFNLGMGEITVILLLALIFLGPKKLPDLATGLGKLIREIRKATSDIKNEITLDDSFRKPFEELRDAVTLHPDELKRRDQMKKVVDEARLRDEAEARAAAAAAVAAPSVPEPSVPEPAEPAALTAGASEAPFDGQALPPIPPQFLTPAGPPAGTVARSRVVAPTDGAADEAAEPAAAIMTSAPAPSPSVSSVSASSASSPVVSPPASSSSPLPGPPRVTPPVSSLSGDRANITQSLSEADLLPSTQPRQKRPTPPPLPGLDKTPSPPIGHLGPPRVTPPVSSLSGDRANVTQVLSENDLLPPATPTLPGGAAKPPPLPGSKKT